MKQLRTSHCRYGRSARGHHCVQQPHFVHGQHVSILLALTIDDGIIGYNIITGSVTAATFIHFLHWYVVSNCIVFCALWFRLERSHIQLLTLALKVSLYWIEDHASMYHHSAFFDSKNWTSSSLQTHIPSFHPTPLTWIPLNKHSLQSNLSCTDIGRTFPCQSLIMPAGASLPQNGYFRALGYAWTLYSCCIYLYIWTIDYW